MNIHRGSLRNVSRARQKSDVRVHRWRRLMVTKAKPQEFSRGVLEYTCCPLIKEQQEGPGKCKPDITTVQLAHPHYKTPSRWRVDPEVCWPKKERNSNNTGEQRQPDVHSVHSSGSVLNVLISPFFSLFQGDTEIKSFRTMCQDDGTWHLPLPQCKIIDCGSPKNLLNGYYTFVSGLRNEYGSIIQYYCHEPFYKFNHVASKNVTVSCAADRKWKTSEDNEVLHCLPVCGRPTVDLSGRGRILKGVTAKKGSFPWQVFLLSGGRGGAMVIGEQWLLTAAHNLEKVTSPENLKVHVGSIDVGELVSSPSLPIESLHVHPGFKLPEYNNDIALIKLKSPITFNEDVMPVCLPEQGAELQKSGWVSGFGVTEDWASSNYLRYISLPIVDQRVCKASLDEAKMTHDDISALTENMFCAGLPEGGEDTCQGDSGSAFVMKNQDEFYAVGIVSWGVDCGKKGRYGMYTHVARYANWIKEIIKGN